MTLYLIRRVLWTIFVLWAVTTVVFFLLNLVGDPAVAQLGPRAQASQIQEFRKRHGLDRPLLVRYAILLKNLAQGDLGRSFRDEQPVIETIRTRIPRTLLLGLMSTLMELTIGLAIGIVAARFKHTWFDASFMTLAFLGISTPSFIWGLFFLDAVAFRLGWFPVGGYGIGFWDHLYHAILPSFTLAIIGAATYARMMRSELIEVLQEDYIRTARAKGASDVRAVLIHGVRTALLPIVTMIGLQLPFLVSGAIITESIFSWPGMGKLAVESIYTPDFPMITAIVIIGCVLVQLGNLLADLSVAALDPRVRFQ